MDLVRSATTADLIGRARPVDAAAAGVERRTPARREEEVVRSMQGCVRGHVQPRPEWNGPAAVVKADAPHHAESGHVSRLARAEPSDLADDSFGLRRPRASVSAEVEAEVVSGRRNREHGGCDRLRPCVRDRAVDGDRRAVPVGSSRPFHRQRGRARLPAEGRPPGTGCHEGSSVAATSASPPWHVPSGFIVHNPPMVSPPRLNRI
jgi:hypothetical protein